MDFIFRINEQIGEIISSNVRGIWGMIINGVLVTVIIGIIGYGVYWIVRLLLTSLVWLAPAIVIVLTIMVIAYLLSKVNRLYK